VWWNGVHGTYVGLTTSIHIPMPPKKSWSMGYHTHIQIHTCFVIPRRSTSVARDEVAFVHFVTGSSH
jgi:hypothetical protein